MKLAVITDSSVYLPQAYIGHPDLYVLDIPIMINGETYVEGKNLTIQEFYPKMQQASRYLSFQRDFWFLAKHPVSD